MSVIAQLDINLRANISKFGKKIDQAGKKVVDLKNTVTSAGSSAASSLGKGVVAAAGAATTAIMALGAAALAAGGALLALTWKQFGYIDSLAKTSDKLGIATEALAGLRHAAEQTGVSASTLDMALQRMVRRVAEAAKGTGEAKDALKELGIDAKKLAQLSPDQQFKILSDAMAGVSNQGDKVRLAMKLFDSEGVALVNTMKGGSKALDAFQKEAEELGIAISRVDAAKVEAANDAWDRMKKSIQGIGVSLAPYLAKAVEAVSNWIAAAIKWVRQFVAEWRPQLTQVYNIWLATWEACKQIFSAIWQAIVAILSPVFDWMIEALGLQGVTWDNFKEGVLRALIAIEFYIKNWRRVWQLSMDKAALGMISFALDLANFFTNVIPQTLLSFAEFTGTMFSNLWENIKGGFTALWDWIAGNDVEFVWAPLTEGWDKAMREIEQAAARPDSPVEKALKSMIKDEEKGLQRDLNAFTEKRMAELNKTKEKVEEVKAPEIPDIQVDTSNVPKEIKGKVETPKAVERGSQAAFDIIAQSMNRREEKVQFDIARATKQAAESLKVLVKLAEDSGLMPAELGV